MAYRRVDSDPDPALVRRLTFVLFATDGTCLALPGDDDRLRLLTGDVLAGEEPFADADFRIPMMTAGYFRQRLHSVAVDDLADGLHLFAFVEGARYQGPRSHAEVDLIEVSDEELAERVGDEYLERVVLDAADAYRTQTEDSFYADNIRTLEASYLRATTAEGGSGSGATPEQWREQRGTIVDGVEREGNFLDLGCANGHLMDSVHAWSAERGLVIEPYGVDIGPGLVKLARQRLPQWADRIFEGNALTWTHPERMRFTYVHLLLDLVLPRWRYDLLDHALTSLVESDGRLLLSHYAKEPPSARAIVEGLGFQVAGGSGQTVWIDA